MSPKTEVSVPSDKLREMEKGKVEVTDKRIKKRENTIKSEEKASNGYKNKSMFIYLLISESILLVLTIACFSVAIFTPNTFFDITVQQFGTYYLTQLTIKNWVFLLVLPVSAFALINTYLYIFGLAPKDRYKIFIIRFLLMFSFISLSIPLINPEYTSYERRDLMILGFLVLIYVFFSQTLLKFYLLTSNKTTKETLFRKPISGSPSEVEWRKYNYISGYFAIISGVFLLQPFWLFYHFLVRPKSIRKKKTKLILQSLKFHEEVNLSPISLELGISLEEVIFILKQLSLKRHISIEFTRYGAILHEIRKTKWFTPVLQEKHVNYLLKKEQNEAERKANTFIELSERKKMLLTDFRRALGLSDKISVRELILLLPHKVIKYKKNPFNGKQFIVFDTDQVLLKRERIIKTFVDNRTKFFKK
ncbi:MAG: hypothetical protein ACTSUR_00480 [Candidatus Heimdallarchaeaceae archaeon]